VTSHSPNGARAATRSIGQRTGDGSSCDYEPDQIAARAAEALKKSFSKLQAMTSDVAYCAGFRTRQTWLTMPRQSPTPNAPAVLLESARGTVTVFIGGVAA
jgi:hypothetical protein